MKVLLAALTLILAAGPCRAGADNFPYWPLSLPEALPKLNRNHCTYSPWNGPYCSDHCGVGYTFYYCSNRSFGCCHVGVGYCDWNGSLRCAPPFLL